MDNPFINLTEQEQQTVLALNACMLANDFDTFDMLLEELSEERREAILKLFKQAYEFLDAYFTKDENK